ncbi:MAG: hypothetical protein DRO00_06080 [Thermoproteota archaeon]|nr:MAG: hypothetical protein DRO00_06080 [Candidatus Korarchaeota archaeon]
MLKGIKCKKLALFVGLLTTLLLIGASFYLRSADRARCTSAPDLRYVNITLIAHLFSNRDIDQSFDIYFPIPPDTENQKVISLSFSTSPDEMLEDEWNQSIARFKISSMKEGEIKQISMSCIVRLISIEYNVDPDEIGSLEEIPEEIRLLYTRDEGMYKISDPVVVSAVNDAIRGEQKVYDIVIRSHDYVIERLSYKLDPRWDDAPTTLSKGEGSCSEYVFAFIALCRAAGVPSRFVGGTVIDPALAGTMLRAELTDYTFHRWAEVYIPNYGWLPVDVTYDDGPDPREFLFSLPDTFFAFVRRGGYSKYLGWSYLPSLNPKVDGVLLRSRALWTPILEAQEALSCVHIAEKILFQSDKVANISRVGEIRELIDKSLKELDKGEFSSALFYGRKALSMARDLEGSTEKDNTLLTGFLLILFSILTVSLISKLRKAHIR